MELELVYNEETQEWEQRKEPFITIEVETEEDFEFIGNAIAFYKKQLEKQEKLQTNADRIRAMSDEELAHFMAERNVNESTLLLLNKDHRLTAVQIEALKHNIYCACMQWLRMPAEGE